MRGGVDVYSIIMDLRYAFRSFKRTPGLVIAALLTIGLGIGANTAIFSIVNGILLTPLAYPQSDRMVSIWPEKRHSVPMVRELTEETESFVAVSAVTGAQFTLVGEGEPELVSTAVVGADHFRVIGIQPMLGRPFSADDALGSNGPVVILSHELWTRRFGADSSIIDRMIDLSGNEASRHLVVGVLPSDFPRWWANSQAWVPMIVNENAPGYYGSYGASLLGRLKDGVAVDQASREVARLVPSFTERHPTQFRDVRLSPVDVVPLREISVRDVRGRLLLMLGAVGMVLLIACTNVANLLLARGAARRQETGLRMALGADHRRVARLVFTESALLALVGGAIGTAVAAVSLPLLVTQLANRLPRTAFVELDLRVLGFALGATALAGALFGVGPAMRAARQHPAEAMGDSTRGGGMGRRRVRLNDMLVVTEVALSLVLVLGAGLMLKSLWRLSAVDPGFDGASTLTMRLVFPAGRYDSLPARQALVDDLTERVQALPGVDEVAWTNYLPLFGGSAGIPYLVEGQELPEGAPSIVGGYKIVSPAFFDIFEMPLVAGRRFAPQDVDDGDLVVLINETMARRHWASGDPLGANILSVTTGEPFAQIVGVVGDIRQEELAAPPDPEFYFVGAQGGYDYRYLLLRTRADPLGLAEPVQSLIRSVDGEIPILDVQTMADVIELNLGSSRFYLRLFGTFAALAMFLGIVGVYGVMAYAVSQRRHEIGVRVALGATRGEILFSTIRQGMGTVLIGISLGLGGALAASRLLSGFLYEVQPNDPWVYLAVAALLAGAGAMANLIPAWRAARLDPVGALRMS